MTLEDWDRIRFIDSALMYSFIEILQKIQNYCDKGLGRKVNIRFLPLGDTNKIIDPETKEEIKAKLTDYCFNKNISAGELMRSIMDKIESEDANVVIMGRAWYDFFSKSMQSINISMFVGKEYIED